MNEKLIGEKNDKKNVNKSVIETKMKQKYGQYEKIIKYINENFKVFSVMGTGILTILFFVIKSMLYSYEAGRFYVYNINRNYINLSQENFLFQILYVGAMFIVICAIDYFYYSVSASASGFKKRVYLILFWLLEIFLVYSLLILLSNFTTYEFIMEFVKCSFKEKIIIVLMIVYVCFMINFFGIMAKKAFKNNKSKKKKEDKSNRNQIEEQNGKQQSTTKKSKRYDGIGIIAAIIVSIAFGIIMFSLCGMFYENNREGYKITFVEQTECTGQDNQYIFTFEGKEGEIYPIIYENEQYYILCKIYQLDGVVKLNTDYQKIIKKENVETWYINNIYDLNNIK